MEKYLYKFNDFDPENWTLKFLLYYISEKKFNIHFWRRKKKSDQSVAKISINVYWIRILLLNYEF